MRARCSSLPRLFACAGSGSAQRDLKSVDSKESESGNRVHDALREYFTTTRIIELEARELWVFETFKNKALEIIGEGTVLHGDVVRTVAEQSFEAEAGNHALTGSIDLYVEFVNGHYILIDWKSGFKEQVKAHENRQLQGYALCLFNACGASSITAYIFSAGDDGDARFLPCEYLGEHYLALLEMMSARMDYCELHQDERKTGDHCQYCLAAGSHDRCQESCHEVTELARYEGVRDVEMMIDPVEIAKVMQACKYAAMIERQLKDRLRQLWEEDQLALCDVFEEKSGNNVAKIAKTDVAYSIIVGDGLVDKDEFLSITSVPVGKLVSACQPVLSARGIPVKNHRKHIDSMLGDALEYKKNSSSIVIKKA